MSEAKYAVWDIESSGVSVLEDRIVQFFFATADKNGNLLETHEWFIDPGVDVPKEASDIHGLDTAWLRENGRDPKEALTEILFLFRQHWKLTQIAYNMAFDLSMLHAEFVRHGVSETFGPAMAEKATLFDPYVTDRAKDKYRRGKRKLMNLADHYGVDYNEGDLHNAVADVTLTAKVAIAVENKYGLPTNAQQAQYHNDWAMGFRDYLRKQGKSEDEVAGVSGDWPLRLK